MKIIISLYSFILYLYIIYKYLFIKIIKYSNLKKYIQKIVYIYIYFQINNIKITIDISENLNNIHNERLIHSKTNGVYQDAQCDHVHSLYIHL